MPGGKLIGGPFFKQLLSRISGLTLHYFRGVPTHDATNSFKLYDAQMVRELRVESVAGFELGLELTVKAFLNGYRIAEIPSVWRDRTAGTSRFRVMHWMPHYLKWYFHAFRPKLKRSGRRSGDSMRTNEPRFNTSGGLSPLKGLLSRCFDRERTCSGITT